MKEVIWKWDHGVYAPFCPHCGEPAYYDGHCAFCEKPYRRKNKCLIDADELLETIETYTPSLGDGASPGFVAGVYYCLHHIMPILIRAAKTEAEDMELANQTIEEMRRKYDL